MAMYRKRPISIEAFQWEAFHSRTIPDWFYENHNQWRRVGDDLYISTLEGNMRVSVDDFVIKGIQGELYPCKPDIFTASYEEIEEPDHDEGGSGAWGDPFNQR